MKLQQQQKSVNVRHRPQIAYAKRIFKNIEMQTINLQTTPTEV